MADYFICRLSGVPADFEDQLSEVCFSFGAEGVSQEMAFTQPDLEYQPIAVDQLSLNLDVYFLQPPSPEFIERVRLLVPSVRVEIMGEQNKDWLAEWKKGFKPFELTNGVWVVPSWLQAPIEARKCLSIDPGMAFGTGHHATTRMSSRLIAHSMAQESTNTVLDVGTGTGVLALLAENLGAGKVVGIDNDPEALRVARENIDINQSQVKVSTQALHEVQESFDVVVANIIDSVLIRLKPDLLRATSRSLIVSGILKEREELFLTDFLKSPEIQLVESESEDGWCAFHFKKSTAQSLAENRE